MAYAARQSFKSSILKYFMSCLPVYRKHQSQLAYSYRLTETCTDAVCGCLCESYSHTTRLWWSIKKWILVWNGLVKDFMPLDLNASKDFPLTFKISGKKRGLRSRTLELIRGTCPGTRDWLGCRSWVFTDPLSIRRAPFSHASYAFRLLGPDVRMSQTHLGQSL